MLCFYIFYLAARHGTSLKIHVMQQVWLGPEPDKRLGTRTIHHVMDICVCHFLCETASIAGKIPLDIFFVIVSSGLRTVAHVLEMKLGRSKIKSCFPILVVILALMLFIFHVPFVCHAAWNLAGHQNSRLYSHSVDKRSTDRHAFCIKTNQNFKIKCKKKRGAFFFRAPGRKKNGIP